MSINPKRNGPDVLDEVYSAGYDITDREIDYLTQIYDMPTVTYQRDVTTKEHFNYFTTISHFLVLVIYTDDQRIYFRTGSSLQPKSDFYFPARHVKSTETIDVVIRRLGAECSSDLHLAGFEPIACLQHSFSFKPDDTVVTEHSMRGLAFVARARSATGVAIAAHHESHGGTFLELFRAREVMGAGQIVRYSNREVTEIALAHLERLFSLHIRYPDCEIEAGLKARRHERVHKQLVRPILNRLKRSTKFYRQIFEVIGQPKKFLDASCGDSARILLSAFERGARICVGNDLSWEGVESARTELREQGRHRNIIFTNHNIIHLPFRKQFFDIALCKNTLHHLSTPGEFRLAIQSLLRVAVKVVLIDVEDPTLRWLPRLINRYYRSFLFDAGRSFFSEQQLEEALASLLGNSDVQFSLRTFKSLHGTYLFATLENSAHESDEMTATQEPSQMLLETD